MTFQTKDVLEKNFKDKADAAGATTQAHKIPQAPAPGSKYTPQDVLEVGIVYTLYVIDIGKLVTVVITWNFSKSMTKPSKWRASSKDSDQPGHPPGLIAFAVCLKKVGHWGSTVGFLLLQSFSGLLDIPGISRCRSQHVSVGSSSLFHHSIYLWFICFPWWSNDELENLHADRTTVWFEPWQKPRARLGTRKTSLSPPVF